MNKCKTFLNSLTNNTLWQDGSNSFIKNDILVSKKFINETIKEFEFKFSILGKKSN